MASKDSTQPTDENVQPSDSADQLAGAPQKTPKQLAKEAEKAEKLKKFEEKQKARALAEEKVSAIYGERGFLSLLSSRKKLKVLKRRLKKRHVT